MVHNILLSLVQRVAPFQGARVTDLGRTVTAAIGAADPAALFLLRHPRYGHDPMRPDRQGGEMRPKAPFASRAGRSVRTTGVFPRTARSAGGAIPSEWLLSTGTVRKPCSSSECPVILSSASYLTNPWRSSKSGRRGTRRFESRARA